MLMYIIRLKPICNCDLMKLCRNPDGNASYSERATTSELLSVEPVHSHYCISGKARVSPSPLLTTGNMAETGAADDSCQTARRE